MKAALLLVAILVAFTSVFAQECILNEDQCTCVRQPRVECLKASPEGQCILEECTEGWLCDCTGFDLCDFREATKYIINGTRLADGRIECEGIPIIAPHAEAPVCDFEGQDCDQACLWSVSVAGQPFPCIRAIPIDVPVDDWYGYTPEESRTSVTEGLLADYINVRITNTTFDNSFYYCSIYSNAQLEDDGDGLSRTVRANVTAGYDLGWRVQDDPMMDGGSDTYSDSPARSLTVTHRFRSDKSDGFCVGPINFRLGGVTVNYGELRNINGLHFQAWEPIESRIVSLDTVQIQRNVDESVGPVIFRPNCFADCLAAIGEL